MGRGLPVRGEVQGQIHRFLVVGSVTVAVDWGTYMGFFRLDAGVALAKAIGYIAGTLFAFFANRSWTFNARRGGFAQFILFGIVYGANMGVNVGVNSGILEILGATPITMAIAFVCATGCSAALNFLGMRYVFLRLTA